MPTGTRPFEQPLAILDAIITDLQKHRPTRSSVGHASGCAAETLKAAPAAPPHTGGDALPAELVAELEGLCAALDRRIDALEQRTQAGVSGGSGTMASLSPPGIPLFVDMAANLTHEEIEGDMEGHIARGIAAGVRTFVNVSTTLVRDLRMLCTELFVRINMTSAMLHSRRKVPEVQKR